MYDEISEVRINFNADMQLWLNWALAVIMLSVAVSLKFSDFKILFSQFKLFLVGIFSQYLVLPLFTFILVWLLNPLPYIALGMFLIAACPGGNVSNFFTFVGRGNVPLSVGLSLFSSLFEFFLTPFQIWFWASRYYKTELLLTEVSLDFAQIAQIVFLVMLIPLLFGMALNYFIPFIISKIAKILKIASVIFLIGFIIIGLWGNLDLFYKYFHIFFGIVLLHNSIALIMAFIGSKMLKCSNANAFTISIETGIQNTGLGLLIIFSFFNGNGAMALLAAWWGIWHLISGLIWSFGFKWFQSTYKLQKQK